MRRIASWENDVGEHRSRGLSLGAGNPWGALRSALLVAACCRQDMRNVWSNADGSTRFGHARHTGIVPITAGLVTLPPNYRGMGLPSRDRFPFPHQGRRQSRACVSAWALTPVPPPWSASNQTAKLRRRLLAAGTGCPSPFHRRSQLSVAWPNPRLSHPSLVCLASTPSPCLALTANIARGTLRARSMRPGAGHAQSLAGSVPSGHPVGPVHVPD
jgi:hypothetical protein